jgi:hypothetical protein
VGKCRLDQLGVLCCDNPFNYEFIYICPYAEGDSHLACTAVALNRVTLQTLSYCTTKLSFYLLNSRWHVIGIRLAFLLTIFYFLNDLLLVKVTP